MKFKRNKIILVDDIQANLDQGRSILKNLYDVYPAPSAERLFTMLEKIKPDLILLDIEMPDMDGFETIKALKADDRYSSIPVIFLTAKADEVSEYKGLDLGATDYVSKPFSAPLLLKRIESQLLIVRQTKELKAALDEARSASVAKGSFLANMSHEIRTPLNAIIGMTEIATKTKEMNKIEYCLEKIKNSSTHLLAVLNEILDMSKIEAGKLELEDAEISIKNILIKINDIVAEKIEEKNIRFNVMIDPEIDRLCMGDELRLTQVIANLMSNSVKFTPEGGTVELIVNEIERDAKYSTLRFTVKDTGIGMSKEQMDKLFRPFEQAQKDTSRKYGGTGLGMPISKSIVEMMGGKIWAESTVDEGTSFIFEIKMRRIDDQPDHAYAPMPAKDVKMLIIDNDAHEKEYLEIIVNSFGITPDEVESLEKAVDMAVAAKQDDKPYDVIFMDYSVVNEKSMKYIEYLKALNEESKQDVIIVMSPFLHWNKIEGALHSIGVDRCLSKPLFPSDILNSINEVTGGIVNKKLIDPLSDSDAPDFSDVNVLLAEDVLINQEIFNALLEETKINIDIAENGRIAVEKFLENKDKYNLIIMDVQMPEMDGHQAARTIRSLDIDKAKTIPILAMTANVFKEDIDLCMKAGMNDHLSKPIEVHEVFKKISHWAHTA